MASIDETLNGEEAELLEPTQEVELAKPPSIWAEYSTIIFFIIRKLTPVNYYVASLFGIIIPFVVYIILFYLMVGDLYFTQAFYGLKLVGMGWEWQWSKIFSWPFVYTVDKSNLIENPYFIPIFWCGLAFGCIFWGIAALGTMIFSSFFAGLYLLIIPCGINCLDLYGFVSCAKYGTLQNSTKIENGEVQVGDAEQLSFPVEGNNENFDLQDDE